MVVSTLRAAPLCYYAAASLRIYYSALPIRKPAVSPAQYCARHLFMLLCLIQKLMMVKKRLTTCYDSAAQLPRKKRQPAMQSTLLKGIHPNKPCKT
jgi:hypothetical protein